MLTLHLLDPSCKLHTGLTVSQSPMGQCHCTARLMKGGQRQMIDNNLGYRPCSPYGLPISSSFGLFGSRALRCSRAECDDASFVAGSALEAPALYIVLRLSVDSS